MSGIAAPRRGNRAAVGLFAGGVALLVVGGIAQALAPSATPADAGSVPAVATSGPGTLALPATKAPGTPPGARPARPVPPARIGLPGGAARVVPAGVVQGGLALPEDVDEVGWWTGGAGVNAAAGSIVLAGHVDSARQGLGAFAQLRDLPLGARVTVRGGTGAAREFVISGRRSYAKAALPASVFAQGGPPRLVLITCTGRFDPAKHSYEDNLVVYATPA